MKGRGSLQFSPLFMPLPVYLFVPAYRPSTRMNVVLSWSPDHERHL